MVATAAIRLTDALVSSTSGNIGTQTNTRSTEVVQRVEGGQAALDVLFAATGDRVVGGHVAVDTVRQVEGNVIGQEVTDTGTVELAFVFEAALAVAQVVLAECFHFNGALALGQHTEGGSRDERTNDKAQGVFQFHPLNPQQGNFLAACIRLTARQKV
ncbi:hypothetical protein D3C81_1475300 [compost metagenome]